MVLAAVKGGCMTVTWATLTARMARGSLPPALVCYTLYECPWDLAREYSAHASQATSCRGGVRHSRPARAHRLQRLALHGCMKLHYEVAAALWAQNM
eukprot:350583-Chlamydomonas_euryale.AAC.5